MSVCMCVCMCVCICVCMCVYMCVCVFVVCVSRVCFLQSLRNATTSQHLCDSLHCRDCSTNTNVINDIIYVSYLLLSAASDRVCRMIVINDDVFLILQYMDHEEVFLDISIVCLCLD